MKYDAIIILGGGIGRNGELLASSKERADELLKHKELAGIPVIASGRWGASINYKPPKTEAEVIKDYLVERHWPAKIYLERKSLDTIGNAYFSKKIIDKYVWKIFLIITSDYHIKRARWIFKKIFGRGYKINFLVALSGKFKEKQEKEKHILNFTKKFFNLVSPEKFSLKDHPFYSNTRKAKEIMQEIKKYSS